MDFREVLEYGEPMGKIDPPVGRLAEAMACINRDRHFYACYNVGNEIHVKGYQRLLSESRAMWSLNWQILIVLTKQKNKTLTLSSPKLQRTGK